MSVDVDRLTEIVTLLTKPNLSCFCLVYLPPLLSITYLHSNNPAHRYYLATDPVTGQLYVSDTNSRRIYRPKMLSGARDLISKHALHFHCNTVLVEKQISVSIVHFNAMFSWPLQSLKYDREKIKDRRHCVFSGNGEVLAGTGEQCPPFDEARCGDGRKATEAQLLGPKGAYPNTHTLFHNHRILQTHTHRHKVWPVPPNSNLGLYFSYVSELEDFCSICTVREVVCRI